jgi:cytidylate kinase
MTARGQKPKAPKAPPRVVAIDGPSGVGKSTAARLLAERLRVPFLDTGAMYRAIGLKVLESGVDPLDRQAVEALSLTADVQLVQRDPSAYEIVLDGRPVDAELRTAEVGEATSKIAAYPEVRKRLVAIQRETAAASGGVLEGRDIGTKVVPETPFKFFLDARPDVRFRRRYEELRARGRDVGYDQVVDEITSRDLRDSTRTESPLTRDDSYIVIDSSDLPAEKVVARMVQEIERRG